MYALPSGFKQSGNEQSTNLAILASKQDQFFTAHLNSMSLALLHLVTHSCRNIDVLTLKPMKIGLEADVAT